MLSLIHISRGYHKQSLMCHVVQVSALSLPIHTNLLVYRLRFIMHRTIAASYLEQLVSVNGHHVINKHAHLYWLLYLVFCLFVLPPIRLCKSTVSVCFFINLCVFLSFFLRCTMFTTLLLRCYAHSCYKHVKTFKYVAKTSNSRLQHVSD